MAAMMIGDQPIVALDSRQSAPTDAPPVLTVTNVIATDRTGLKHIAIDDLVVRAGEIVGIAGISGNGQKEFLEVLAGQRERLRGSILVRGAPYFATREESRRLNVRFIPEEPLRNACVAAMSVAENLALREFDTAPLARAGWLSPSRLVAAAMPRIEAFGVKTRGPDAPIGTLSGGNVQRAVLARELSRGCRVLVVMNPVFGLDFAAVDEIHRRLLEARNEGAAVLLVSEDLDELIELSDRVLVMSEGMLVYETASAAEDRAEIGRRMGGAHEASHETPPGPRAVAQEVACSDLHPPSGAPPRSRASTRSSRRAPRW